jgi:hypothetical protein
MEVMPNTAWRRLLSAIHCLRTSQTLTQRLFCALASSATGVCDKQDWLETNGRARASACMDSALQDMFVSNSQALAVLKFTYAHGIVNAIKRWLLN